MESPPIHFVLQHTYWKLGSFSRFFKTINETLVSERQQAHFKTVKLNQFLGYCKVQSYKKRSWLTSRAMVNLSFLYLISCSFIFTIRLFYFLSFFKLLDLLPFCSIMEEADFNSWVRTLDCLLLLGPSLDLLAKVLQFFWLCFFTCKIGPLILLRWNNLWCLQQLFLQLFPFTVGSSLNEIRSSKWLC